jgi:HEPN domain-containing protein
LKPFTIYYFRRESFSFQQQKLVEAVVEVAKPDMIFLLGASLYRRRTESIFNDPAPTSQNTSDYFLLILIRDLSNRELHEWQDKIENRCKLIMPVTTIVLQTATYEEWLKAGHRFAVTVWQSAVPIYKSANLFREASKSIAGTGIDMDFEKQFVDGLTKAKEFLAGSELFQVRKQNTMAAFMLHQSAEQSLRTLLKTGTGFHANTHNIGRLLRYASLVSYQLPDIFPQKTEQDKRLFDLLQKAYIDARYKENYKINSDDLQCLTEKVRYIQEILSDVGSRSFNTSAPAT